MSMYIYLCCLPLHTSPVRPSSFPSNSQMALTFRAVSLLGGLATNSNSLLDTSLPTPITEHKTVSKKSCPHGC